jgi:proteasome accessory factor B
VGIRFDKRVSDYIREKRWHPSQSLVELEDGGVEVQLKLGSLVEVQRWILGWGGDAQVLRPPALMESVRAAARRILGQPESSH